MKFCRPEASKPQFYTPSAKLAFSFATNLPFIPAIATISEIAVLEFGTTSHRVATAVLSHPVDARPARTPTTEATKRWRSGRRHRTPPHLAPKLPGASQRRHAQRGTAAGAQRMSSTWRRARRVAATSRTSFALSSRSSPWLRRAREVRPGNFESPFAVSTGVLWEGMSRMWAGFWPSTVHQCVASVCGLRGLHKNGRCI